jgi:hypothetical protein
MILPKCLTKIRTNLKEKKTGGHQLKNEIFFGSLDS